MNERSERVDASAVAAAIGWRRETLETLLTNTQEQARVREVCEVGHALRATVDPSDGFEQRVMAALRAEGVGSLSSADPVPSLPGDHVGSGSSLWTGVAVVGASVAATFTTLFGLLATGARADTGPIPVAVTALAAGMLVAYRELTNRKTVDSVLAPRNRRL